MAPLLLDLSGRESYQMTIRSQEANGWSTGTNLKACGIRLTIGIQMVAIWITDDLPFMAVLAGCRRRVGQKDPRQSARLAEERDTGTRSRVGAEN
ncbi:MAG: hypothetical protein ABR910_08525 [Acidobacteriaceae bacterium]